MDVSEIGERRINRYGLEQLVSLNNADLVLTPGSEVDKFMQQFYDKPMKVTKYPNQHNKLLFTKQEKRKNFIKQTDIYSDNKIITDIRNIIKHIQKNNSDKIKMANKRLEFLNIPANQSNNIAELFYQSMIDGEFLIDEYLEVFFNFEHKNKKMLFEIYNRFLNLLILQFRNPRKFEDSTTETGEHKEMRYKKCNSIILAKMMLRKYERPELKTVSNNMTIEQMTRNFVTPLVKSLKPGNSVAIEVFVLVWGICSEKIKEDLPLEHAKIIKIIDDITENEDYNLTDRVKLMSLESE